MPSTTRTEAQEQSTPTHFLKRGRHHAKCSRMAIGDVEDHWPERDTRHCRRNGSYGRPALRHPLLAVHRPRQGVIQPYAVEPLTLGGHGSLFCVVSPCTQV